MDHEGAWKLRREEKATAARYYRQRRQIASAPSRIYDNRTRHARHSITQLPNSGISFFCNALCGQKPIPENAIRVVNSSYLLAKNDGK
jgi:hypothetical protein